MESVWVVEIEIKRGELVSYTVVIRQWYFRMHANRKPTPKPAIPCGMRPIAAKHVQSN